MLRTSCVLIVLLLVGCASAPDPAKEVAGAMALAREAYDQGKVAQARDELLGMRHAVTEPEEKAAYDILLGDCHLALADYEAASESFYRGLGANDGRDRELEYRARLGLGDAHLGLRNWGTADRQLDDALKSAATRQQRDRVYLRKCSAALGKGDKGKARRQLEQVGDKSLHTYGQLQRRVGPADRPVSTARVVSARPSSAGANLAPMIRPRSDWRASPPIRKRLVSLGNPYRITIHHSGERAKRAAPQDLSSAQRRMRSYQSSHQKGAGWGDIGYHYVIDGAGRIFEGREIRWQGAHGGNPAANRGNIGICVMGNSNEHEPTVGQKTGLKLLCQFLMRRYGIPASRVKGHNDVRKEHGIGGTACPGVHLASYMKKLKRTL